MQLQKKSFAQETDAYEKKSISKQPIRHTVRDLVYLSGLITFGVNHQNE